jgi:hypothetical protein
MPKRVVPAKAGIATGGHTVEEFAWPQNAIAREKQSKNWHRDWKIQLIKKGNLDWSDLSHLLSRHGFCDTDFGSRLSPERRTKM